MSASVDPNKVRVKSNARSYCPADFAHTCPFSILRWAMSEEAGSRRRAEASQPSPSKSKAGTAAEVTSGSSLGTISSAKRPFPDEGTAVLDEQATSRMRPASTATTASELPGKRKSTHQALPEGGAHGGEEPARPSVPASKYAHGTLRPGADGKSQWRVEEQPGGAACCWQRVLAVEPRSVRRPPALAAKRPPEAEAPSGADDVMPAAQAAAARTERVSPADAAPSHAEPSSASSSAEPPPPQAKRKPGRPPKLGAKPALTKLEAKPGTRPSEARERTQEEPAIGDTQPAEAGLVSSHLRKHPAKAVTVGKGDTQPTKVGLDAMGGRDGPTKGSNSADTEAEPPGSVKQAGSKQAAGSKRPLPPPSEGRGEGSGGNSGENHARREAVGLPPSNSRLGRPPKQSKPAAGSGAVHASTAAAAVHASTAAAAVYASTAAASTAASASTAAGSGAFYTSTARAITTAATAAITTAAERVRAGLEKAAIKCHSCGGVKPARNARCMAEVREGYDVGMPCPGGEVGYKARLQRERDAVMQAKARTKEPTTTPTPTLTPTLPLTLTQH